MERSAPEALERSRFRNLAPPASLSALFVIVVLVGLAWALVVPPWQSPDEVAHFAYVQSLAEDFDLPGIKGHPGDSTDQADADNAVGASRGAFYPQSAPPDWSRSDWDAYLAQVRTNPPPRTNGDGPNPASTNPPLYYLYGDIAYLVDHGGTAFGRLYAIKIWGLLLLVGTTLAAWLLAGEVFGRRRLPQLACAAVAGLLPMETFISTSVNPDALMIALWTFALWLGARVINRCAAGRDAIALCAVTAAAVLTKATSYALIAPVLLAIVVGIWRRPETERRTSRRGLAAAGLVLVVPIVGWLGLATALGRSGVNTIAPGPGARSFNLREFISYVWQYYLPRLSFLTPFRTTAQLPAYDVWVRQGTGTFGWLDVLLPHWMYQAAAIVLGVIAITTVLLLTRLRNRRHLVLLAFFALTLVALLGLLHITEYRSIIAAKGPVLQGRYLLPAVGLLGLAVGLIVARMPIRARPSATGLVLVGLFLMQTISLASIIRGYYL
jgi:4-amino-4-deoxy-L-arabinose transferase-like glycosyltransferase